MADPIEGLRKRLKSGAATQRLEEWRKETLGVDSPQGEPKGPKSLAEEEDWGKYAQLVKRIGTAVTDGIGSLGRYEKHRAYHHRKMRLENVLGPNAPQKMKDRVEREYQESYNLGDKLDKAMPKMNPDPIYKKGLMGDLETALTGVARFAPTMVAAPISPGASYLMTHAMIASDKYEQYRGNNVDEDHAWNTANLGASMEAAVETLGNVFQVGQLARIMGIGTRAVKPAVAKMVSPIIRNSMAEGIEEYTQAHLEVISDQIAANPGMDGDQLWSSVSRIWKTKAFQKRARESAKIGAIGGFFPGAAAGGGRLVVHNARKRMDQARKQAFHQELTNELNEQPKLIEWDGVIYAGYDPVHHEEKVDEKKPAKEEIKEVQPVKVEEKKEPEAATEEDLGPEHETRRQKILAAEKEVLKRVDPKRAAGVPPIAKAAMEELERGGRPETTEEVKAPTPEPKFSVEVSKEQERKRRFTWGKQEKAAFQAEDGTIIEGGVIPGITPSEARRTPGKIGKYKLAAANAKKRAQAQGYNIKKGRMGTVDAEGNFTGADVIAEKTKADIEQKVFERAGKKEEKKRKAKEVLSKFEESERKKKGKKVTKLDRGVMKKMGNATAKRAVRKTVAETALGKDIDKQDLVQTAQEAIVEHLRDVHKEGKKAGRPKVTGVQKKKALRGKEGEAGKLNNELFGVAKNAVRNRIKELVGQPTGRKRADVIRAIERGETLAPKQFQEGVEKGIQKVEKGEVSTLDPDKVKEGMERQAAKLDTIEIGQAERGRYEQLLDNKQNHLKNMRRATKDETKLKHAAEIKKIDKELKKLEKTAPERRPGKVKKIKPTEHKPQKKVIEVKKQKISGPSKLQGKKVSAEAIKKHVIQRGGKTIALEKAPEQKKVPKHEPKVSKERKEDLATRTRGIGGKVEPSRVSKVEIPKKKIPPKTEKAKEDKKEVKMGAHRIFQGGDGLWYAYRAGKPNEVMGKNASLTEDGYKTKAGAQAMVAREEAKRPALPPPIKKKPKSEKRTKEQVAVRNRKAAEQRIKKREQQIKKKVAEEFDNESAQTKDAMAQVHKAFGSPGERGEISIDFGSMAQGAIDRAKQLGDWFARKTDVEYLWKRNGMPKVGQEIKIMFGKRKAYQEKTEQQLKAFIDLTRRNLGGTASREDLADIVLSAEKKDYFNKLPEDRQQKLKKSVEWMRAYFDQAQRDLKAKGIDVDFKKRMLADLKEKHAEFKKADFDSFRELENRIAEIEKMEFIHVPLMAWMDQTVKEIRRSKPGSKEGKKKIAQLKRLTTKKRRSLSIEHLLKKGFITKDQINPISIIMSYGRRVGTDLAYADIRDAAIKEGAIRVGGKKPTRKDTGIGWSHAPKTLEAFNVDGKKVWIRNDMIQILADTKAAVDQQGWFTKAMSIIKMSSFYNPLFLPAYDAIQHGMAVGPIKAARNLNPLGKRFRKALKDVYSKTPDYYEAQNNGLSSTPFDVPWNEFQDNIDTLTEITTAPAGTKLEKLRTRHPEYHAIAMKALHTLKVDATKTGSVLRSLYKGSWSLAWQLDSVVRQVTYNEMIKDGHSPREAGQIGAKFHGDYAGVPASTRKTLNKLFFTPTFKIAMSKLYGNMISGVWNTTRTMLKGKSPSQKQKVFAYGALSTVMINLGWHMFMTMNGFDDDEPGRKYVKKIKTSTGEKELVITYSNPANMFSKYMSRAWAAWGSENPIGTMFDMNSWEIHPLYRTMYQLKENKKPGGQPIYEEFDDPHEKAFKIAWHGFSNIFALLDAASRFVSREPKAIADAREAIEKDGNMFIELLNNRLMPFIFAYTRLPEKRRQVIKIQKKKRNLKALMRKSAREYPEDKEKRKKYVRNFRKQLKNILDEGKD